MVRGLISLTQALLIGAGLGAGQQALRALPTRERRPGVLAAIGALAGGTAMLMLALLAAVLSRVNMREILVNATPELVDVLSLGLPLLAGAVALVVGGAVLGAAGALWSLVPPRWRQIVLVAVGAVVGVGILREKGLTIVSALLLGLAVGGAAYADRIVRPMLKGRYVEAREPPGRAGALPSRTVWRLLLLLLLPSLIGIYGTSVIDLVGLYVLMGLGLNIVVGFAGLLDLGYVAFFAIGAYTTGMLTSPASTGCTFGLNFWLALPFAVLVRRWRPRCWRSRCCGCAATTWRSSHWALARSSAFSSCRLAQRPCSAARRASRAFPGPALRWSSVPGRRYSLLLPDPAGMPGRGSSSHCGWQTRQSGAPGWRCVRTRTWPRPWASTWCAQAAGLCHRRRLRRPRRRHLRLVGASIFPHCFNLLVSINVLSLIIVGGMGSIPGVIVGALVLVGLPEVLREFAEYRLLVYGALLVVMMLARPEGLLPAQRASPRAGTSTSAAGQGGGDQ